MVTQMQKNSLDQLKAFFKENQESILNDYFTFLRFPSISTDPAHKKDVRACAEWLTHYLRDIDLDVQLWETQGHPIIFASDLNAGPDKPTLLLYGHYDVQPIDPLPEWKTPPFEPTVKNGEVYARGAQDNKGQIFYTIQALKALRQLKGKFPINIKLCIEGEEECGSVSLGKILPEKQKELVADYLAIVDVGIHSKDCPCITLGIRGLVTMEVEAQGSTTDLHSGSHGGIVYNPIHALVEMLSSLRDHSGKVTVPGFYDDVVPVSEEERKTICWKFDEEKYATSFGAKPTGGEKNLSPQERAWTRPTLEINSVCGGYIGAGFKTVIPAKATAKISCRTVPNQRPQHVASLVAKYLEKIAPEGIKVTTKIHPGGGPSVKASMNSRIVKVFADAYSEVFNKKCDYILEGASIPIVSAMTQACGSEVILVGLGLADDQIHAPNEHFGLDRFEKGYLIIARTIELL